jgi:hypothetical protein
MNEYLGNEELGKHAEIPGIGLVSGILGGLVSLMPAGKLAGYWATTALTTIGIDVPLTAIAQARLGQAFRWPVSPS